MADMKPAFKASRGSVPAEALRNATGNETIPEEQKAPNLSGIATSDGPRLSEIGGHLPATYKVGSGYRTDR